MAIEKLPSLLDAWAIPRPRVIRRPDAGTNNLSCFVDTPSESYFLRVYQNTSDPRRVRYEHDLLGALARVGLPFAVPHSVTTRSGETFIGFAGANGTGLAALFPVISGRHPDRGNRVEARVSGAALGQLDRALAGLDIPSSFPRPTYGDLTRIHPLVADPLAMVATLPVGRVDRERVGRVIQDVMATIPRRYATLPRQIIHADFARSNLLLDDQRVTGILDFEFAGPDLRAMDLVCGLWSFSVSAWGSGDEWPIIDAFAGGYAAQNPLVVDEIDALPTLLRLREVTALVHRVGRWRQGLATESAIVSRVADLLALDAWLGSAGGELIHVVADASVAS